MVCFVNVSQKFEGEWTGKTQKEVVSVEVVWKEEPIACFLLFVPDHSLVCGEKPVCHSDCSHFFRFHLRSGPQTWFQCKALGTGNGSYHSRLEREIQCYCELSGKSRIVESFTLSRASHVWVQAFKVKRQNTIPTRERARGWDLGGFTHSNLLKIVSDVMKCVLAPLYI